MATRKRYTRKHAKAKRRQRLNAQARHTQQQQQAQRDIDALHHVRHDVGLPDNVVLDLAGRLRAQQKLLGKIFGLMFPTLFGCTSAYELTRVRGWDKPMPSRLLGARPKRSWLKRVRQRSHDICVPCGATSSRCVPLPEAAGNGRGCGMTPCFAHTARTLPLWAHGRVASTSCVVSGINGVLLLIVIGEGQLVVPVDCAVRLTPKGQAHGVAIRWSRLR